MTDTEARVAAALKAELDQIEPSPSSWEVIRDASAETPPQAQPPRRPRWYLAVAAVVILMLLAGGLVTALRGGDDLTVVAGEDETGPGSVAPEGGGLVVDDVGDASAAHVDLVSAELQSVVDGLRIVWRLAGPIPAAPDPIEYRVTFTDSAGEVTPLVVRVRVEGDRRAAAVARCPANDSGTADCAGQSFEALATPPEVQGDRIAITVPAPEIGIPVNRLVWTAEVLELR